MKDFEEAVQNIDVFCKVLVKKMTENTTESQKITVEPIENLLRVKCVADEPLETNPLTKPFIPLPHIEETLIDVFEEDNYVRILVQCRCREQQVKFHTCIDGLKICKRECRVDADGKETCMENCRKVNLRTEHLQIENMISKCNNNEILEAIIPKVNATVK